MAEIFTGVRCRFLLGGVKVGFATGVTVRENITYEPIKVLDDIITKEHAPTDYDVSMTADVVRIVSDTWVTRQQFPKQGKTNEEFLTNILNSGELVAALEDNQTGEVLAMVEGVKIAEQNMTIQARGVVGQNVSMVARKMRGEGDIA